MTSELHFSIIKYIIPSFFKPIVMKIHSHIEFVKPIIISETEKIKKGDYYLTNNGKIFMYDGKFPLSNKCFKILVLPEHFLSKQLQVIAKRWVKDGDKIFVECKQKQEEFCGGAMVVVKIGYGAYKCQICENTILEYEGNGVCRNIVKVTSTIKHPLTLHRFEETWDDIFNDAKMKHGCHTITQYLKENYHIPKRK